MTLCFCSLAASSGFLYFISMEGLCFRFADPSDCAVCIAEVIMCGMEAYVPFSFPTSSSSYQPWFDEACSESISIRNRAHQLWKTNPTPYSHSNFISARNRAHSIIKNLKQNFIKKKCDDFSNNPSHRSFWSLAKQITPNFTNSSFSPLFRPDGSVASTSVDKATIFDKKFASTYLFLIMFYLFSFCLPEMFSQLL